MTWQISAERGLTVFEELDLSGGFGHVPLTFVGLDGHEGSRLERQLGGSWVSIGQEVEGNDYSQARYDPLSGSYELTFNVDNTGTTRYRLIR